MKKSFKVILPLLLLAVLVIFGAKTARAEELVPVKTIANSSTSKPSYSESLSVGRYVFDGSDTYDESNWVFTPYYFTATATGKVWYDVKAGAANTYGIASAIGTVQNSQLNHYGVAYTNEGTTQTGLGGYDVVKGKTYCIGVASFDTNDTVQLRAYIYSYANNRTLKASSSTFTLASGVKGASNESTTLYYKVTPTKTGVMTVTLKNYGYDGSAGYITLLNSGKKALSEKVEFNSKTEGYKVRFGVKKGATYYLKVTTPYVSDSQCYKYGIRYTVSAASDRSLGTKSSAKLLKRGATATKTLFIAKSTTETDWYKFTVTSKRETVIKVDASQMRGSTAKLTITVYKGSKKIDTATLYPGQTGTYTITYGTTYGKANKGTYYVKITRSTKLSGLYKVKYVK